MDAPFIFPEFDPVLIAIGPFAIRWYALAYIVGIVLGWWVVRQMLATPRLWAGAPFQGRAPMTATDMDDLIVWAALGVILGGRIGFVLFYGLVYMPEAFAADPLKVFYVWEGGMSFHGGAIGVILAVIMFSRARGLDMVRVGDLVAAATPIGLFLGRIANFINAELYGRPTESTFGVVFCNDLIRRTHGGTCPAGDVARHPSQLYEAALEGLVLFAILMAMVWLWNALRRPGLVIAVFLGLYGIFRGLIEILFRQPDAFVGDPSALFTMGLTLSLPMIAGALFFLWYALSPRARA
jgi:phosphatidylglycerol---prolipoprotein diacylglyceryl transferase